MSDTTYDTCERMTAAAHARDEEAERLAMTQRAVSDAVAKGYTLALKDLEVAAINCRAFTRGMISRDVLPSYIESARAALAEMEGALQ